MLTNAQFSLLIARIKNVRNNPELPDSISRAIDDISVNFPELELLTPQEQFDQARNFFQQDPSTWTLREFQKFTLWAWKNRPSNN